MKRQRLFKHFDYQLLISALVLIAIGVCSIYSAAQSTCGNIFVIKQLSWAVLGIALFFAIFLIDYKLLFSFSTILYVLIIICLIALFVIGKQRAGAYSWISIGGFSVQPSEFAKVVLILAIARYLVWDNEKRNSFRYVFNTLCIAAVPLMLILKQPDLGTALVLIPIVFAMLYIAGARPSYLIVLIIIGLIALPVMFTFLKDYQKARLLVFINPNIDPLGAGYNIIQSKIAIGSGGLFGKGWLQGTQNQLNFLPERHTDFIFSVIGEEFGLLGGTIVIILFIVIIMRCFNAAKHARDLSGRLLVVGVIMYLSTHVIVNIGMTIGMMPITGLPLPLLSYGGSSMIVTMLALGIVEAVHVRRYMF
ncbi:MAG: rod shape-determining protein RodA [Candidatus Ancaeobacter aquaticus]|nr:rod shape-determining protein RodA [Candidatus Ancaeobacter aquaticus]